MEEDSKMAEKIVAEELIDDFGKALIQEEKSAVTVEKYLWDVSVFFSFIGQRVLSGESRPPAYSFLLK